MREILFRAKRKNNGEWVEGFYIQLPKPSLGATMIANGDLCAEDVGDYIIMNRLKQHSNFSNAYPLEIIECKYYEVIPKTLCQYTGLKDKNGNKIWENDICVLHTNSIDEEDGYFKVEYDEDSAQYILNGDGLTTDFDNVYAMNCEVVGNILDNLELLEL